MYGFSEGNKGSGEVSIDGIAIPRVEKSKYLGWMIQGKRDEDCVV